MKTPDPDATHRVDSVDPVPPRPPDRDAQFAPGTIVAGRYRIATLLGEGGMGEVYRADDTKLAQTVALKFLPARLARNSDLLARLHGEVRLGRQVSHPNVCRTYDIGEWEGAHFVAMEYVDGEDLSRLLRRIGRLSHDKAVEIARGIAAGLAAAHAKGILHRDLKPANVMIDSHGHARITDFGLALPDGTPQEKDIAGTPAYMAPEQLLGAPATVQSDLYALGLVIYELFTGRPAHAARTFPERLRDTATPVTTPSAHIRDIDPLVERIILRCLDPDPEARPRSAREIIESLPGSDALAAALAAGETPSPRVVAAAGSAGVLTRKAGWSLVGVVALMIAAMLWGLSETSMSRFGPLLSPDVLRHRAEAALERFGVPTEGVPIAAFHYNRNYLAWLYQRDEWSPLRNGPPWLPYRLEFGPTPQVSVVAPLDLASPGWVTIEIDTKGRLAYLLAAPKRDWTAAEMDWPALLTAAGLDPKTLRPAAAQSVPPAPFDTLRAWSGTYPNDSVPVRVEAAAWRGRPVYFRITGEWDDGDDPTKGIPFESRSIAAPLLSGLLGIILIGLFLGWRNLRARRGDRAGAARVAAIVFALTSSGSLLLTPLGRGFAAISMFASVVGRSLVMAAMVFVLYIALEPHVRRRWPAVLIGWSRFISGNWRDPMVARDVLIGIAGGTFHAAIVIAIGPLRSAFSGVAPGPYLGSTQRLGGIDGTIGQMLANYGSSFVQAFIAVVLLVILAIVLRRREVAVGALALIFMTVYAFATQGDLLLLAVSACVVAVIIFTLVRFGLLALAVKQGTFLTLAQLPAGIDTSWTVPLVAIPIVAVAAATIWAFLRALGDQSPFPSALDD